MLLRVSILVACLFSSADALKLPNSKISRRAISFGTSALLPAVFISPVAAKYRPSLAEMKGYGGSPVVDEMNDTVGTVKTDLSFAQLVANSVKMQEQQYGRPLTEDEREEIATKIRKFYPNAK